MRPRKQRIITGLVLSLLSVVATSGDTCAADQERYIVRFKTITNASFSAKRFSTSSAVRAEKVLPLDNSVVVKLSAEERAAMA